MLLLNIVTMKGAVAIDKIEPANWYAGMSDASLQLMVYGKGIHMANVSTDYPSARVDSVVRLDSPNYLFVYLNVSGAQPGTMTLKFTNNGSTKEVKYQLLAREMSGDKRMGFTNADVLYLLMPDRFANGNTKNDQVKGMNPYVCDRSKPSLRHGGDLAGIRQHLDYFNQLGVTALWFTPVLENNQPDDGDFSCYHGYATTDYYKVDQRLGTNEEYRQLVGDAHKHGLKVVMDMIFNHCGSAHPWLKDAPSKDWFNSPDYKDDYHQTSYKLTPVLDPYASKVDKAETTEGWFVPSMPDLNQRNPHLMKYLVQNSEWWIETVGIDGIRMDTYPYADRAAMASWLKEINNEYPNFNVVGETWVTEPAYTAAWQKDSKLTNENSNLKTVMDFSFYDKVNMAKNEETNDQFDGLNRVYNNFVYDYLYPNPSSVLAFIENHDTDRFLGDGHDAAALKQALAILLTVNRIPQLYYGVEIMMNGVKKVSDGFVRKDFPGGFPGDTNDALTKAGRTAEQNDMFDTLSRLLKFRKGSDVLINGKQTQFLPHDGVYVLARQLNGRAVITILNGTSKPVAMPLKRYAEVLGGATTGVDVLTGSSIDFSGDTLDLQPRETLVVAIGG